jgi:hypothetical protein
MMTESKRFLYPLAGLLLLSSSLCAQTITVGSASGFPGQQVTVQLDWDPNGNSYRTLQFDVNSDLMVLPSVDTTDCPIEPYITDYLQSSCDQQAAPFDDQVLLGLLNFSNPIPRGNLGQLKYTIAASATPGTVTNLILSGVVIEDNPVPIINNGQITVLEGQAGDFQINAGLNGAWYYPATNGQGFLIDVFPVSKLMFVAWFTFDTELPGESATANLGDPSQRWLTAQGAFVGNQAVLDIYSSADGLFDVRPPVPTSVQDGTLTIEWSDCNTGIATYDIWSIDMQGIIPIERPVTENVPLCESLNEMMQAAE